MEDYILKEINAIGRMIEAMLLKILLIKKSNYTQEIVKTGATELKSQLDLDINTAFTDGKTVYILTEQYGFTDDNLEKFAVLLFEFFIASDDDIEKGEFKMRISEIYRYLDDNGKIYSFDRFNISKELDL